MRVILLALLLFISLYSAQVVDVDIRYQQSKDCRPCHIHIVQQWEKSWHSKSHYEKDEYLLASMKYVSRKTRKSLNAVKVKCATCHNPRISVTSTDTDYEINAIMNLNTDTAIDKAIESDAISEGINCIVCHNIDKIHENKSENVRGINRVEWTKSGMMSGPFDDAASPYHKTQYRDFIGKDTDTLCFVCHANDRSDSGLVFTNMQSEYKKDKKGCVDCHMGPKKIGVASTLRIDNGKARKREVRSHQFEGGHIETFVKDSLKLKLSKKSKNIFVTISNPNPHNIPSGFGARELILDVIYKKDGAKLSKKSVSLTRHYTSRRGKPTIPHLATKMTKDTSIPAQGKKVLKVIRVADATSVEVNLYYRLVNDEVRSILKLKEEIWSRKTLIASKTLQL